MAVKAGDQISIVDVTDAYSIMLTSEAVSLLATSDTSLGTQRTAVTRVVAYMGSEQLTPSVGTITVPSGSGITSAKGTASATGMDITFTFPATLAAGGEISIPVTVNDVTITKKFSYSLSLKGTTGGTGAAAYNYTLTASPDSVVKAENGTLTPSSITFSSARSQGTGSPASYAGRFKIEYTSDGSTWTAGYTSSSNEASKAYTIPAAAILVRCTLYLAGGTSTVLGIKTVPIVANGATGAQGGTGAAGKGVSSITGHYLATSASSGVTTSTSGWSTNVQTITATNKYLWYYETISYVNPTSSSNTTPIIIGTYGDKGETGSQGPQGPQGNAGADAITLVVTSSAGTIFKNSDIVTTLTAHVYKAGVEVTGSALTALGTIKWYKDGATTAAATGQTLSISAGDVSNKVTYIAQLEG